MNSVYLNNMKELLGERYDDYLSSLKDKAKVGIRVNTSKISTLEFEKISEFKLEKVSFCDDGYYVLDDSKISKSPLFHAGLYYIQEPSAMSAVSMFDVKAGMRVLDLCSAPGGKSLQLSNAVGDTGLVVSNDISASRLQAVIKNIEIFGLKNVIVTSIDVESLIPKNTALFDAILVDAPCSGEGMFRKDSDTMRAWNENSNDEYSRIQKSLTTHAQKLLKRDGEMMYSTCTFSPKENEEVVRNLIANSDMELCELQNFKMSDGVYEDLKGAKRLYPFEIEGEGHFLAKLKKVGQKFDSLVESDNYYKSNSFESSNGNKNLNSDESLFVVNKPNSPPVEFRKFMADVLNYDLVGHFAMYGEKLIMEPEFKPNLDGLRVLRSGLYVGDIKKGRFEPSQALAMALKPEQIKNKIDLSLDDLRVIKYLKCETLEMDVENGYRIICLNGLYPLGFVKAQSGVLKNKYPAHWRMQ